MNKLNYEELIKAASRKLGVSPENLRQALNSGDMNAITSHLSPSDKAKLDSIMKNTALTEKLRRQYMGK